ncbi:MmgE/PrpD family protein [Dongia sp.]|uniref:MmgE/PrpD family protein n=1 Tax=Dongia sp. TaxID=1977262 RepID=UPI0035B3FE57
MKAGLTTIDARSTASTAADLPLAVTLARAIVHGHQPLFSVAVREKLRLCVLDFLACALEAHALPWARQAAALAEKGDGRCTIIGSSNPVFPSDAAFANAVAAHGLVREDMHTGSVSHLGVVVLPALFAVAQDCRLSGAALVDAAIVGYEVGGKIGRALVTPEFARVFRPTGFTGPIAGAAALCHLLRLDEAETVSAIAFAANMTGGLNQWPHTGSDEMYFHAGQAAAGAIRAVRLAMAGARGSARALDGEAGLLPAYRPDHNAPGITLFDSPEPELMSVYFKAAPVCNFAQTPCQAAMKLAGAAPIDPARIAAIKVRVSAAARAYPGCDHAGPFERVLQAKMSIHFAVASALLRGSVDEESYRTLDDPAVMRLAGMVEVEVDRDLTAAFPQAQGAEIVITLNDGRKLSERLRDVVPADEALIRRRLIATATKFAGEGRARALEDAVDALDDIPDVNAIMKLAGD